MGDVLGKKWEDAINRRIDKAFESLKTEPLHWKCTQCGAPIEGRKCAYCGTEYLVDLDLESRLIIMVLPHPFDGRYHTVARIPY